MISAMKLSDLQAQLGGELHGDALATSVCIDSRRCEKNDLFVALKGERFDGHDFIENIQHDCAAAIVSDYQSVTLPQLVVKDTQKSLGDIAGLQRLQFNGLLIALTGSAGKTTTKDMLASILSERGSVLATKGNHNNEIGVPLTLFELEGDQQFAVIEMGAAKQGDIAYLCEFTRPNIALVTNALQAHLEGFGSREVIAKTKGEIYEKLGSNDIAIINRDSPYYEQWLQQSASAGCRYSFSLTNKAADILVKPLPNEKNNACEIFYGEASIIVNLALLGQHNIANAAAAATAAIAAGCSLQEIKSGLEKLKPSAGRMWPQKISQQLSIIDDSYNANPEAVKAAIDVLAAMAEKKTLILGNMAELGEASQALHREVGEYANQCGIDQLIAIGPFSEDVTKGFGKNSQAFATIEQYLTMDLPKSHLGMVLVKGSRSAGMERVVKALQALSDNEGIH